MKIFKLLILLLISIVFISCSNYQPAKKIAFVEYKENDTIKVTTYVDGTNKVENMDYLRWKSDKDDRKDDRNNR